MFKSLRNSASNRIEFTIHGVDLAYVNAVRRIIQSDIPTVGFFFDPYKIESNDIIIHENTTSLHNEFTAHRVSLIPLFFDENEVNNFDRARYKFVLEKVNNTAQIMNVTTEDFAIFEDGVELSNPRREKLLPRNAYTKNFILLTRLKPNLYDLKHGETLKIECAPSKNIGRVHSRWSPVSQCCFFNAIDDDSAAKARKAPTTTDKGTFDTLDIYRCFKKDKHDEPNEFVFKIESECNLRPTYLFFKALRVLREKLETFTRKLVEEELEVTSVNNLFQVGIKDEDHTLLNTLQCIIYNFEIRDVSNPLDAKIVYIGYYQPHPLDNMMFLKLKFASATVTTADVREFLADATAKIIAQVDEITHEWVKFSKLDSTNIVEVQEFVSAST